MNTNTIMADDYLLDDDLDDFGPSGFLSGMDDDESALLYDDDDFVNEVMAERDINPTTFRAHDTLPPNANADGYIPDGSVELTSTISDIQRTFKLYSKDGHDYVLYNGNYYRIDGTGTVTIGGIKYDKIR